jgi:chromosome partitioning protein
VTGSIIVVASSKGGCAKTTICAALAVNLATRNYRVAVCDADPNQAFKTWHSTSDASALSVSAEVNHEAIVGHLMGLAESFDAVLCDTGGWANQTSVFAMGAADLVLIPVMADRNSVIEARRTARQVESVSRIARRSISHRIILSRWTPNGLAERATLLDLEDARLPRLDTYLPNLTAFQKASFSGDIPHRGYIGLVLGRLLDEIVMLGVLSPKPGGVAAE